MSQLIPSAMQARVAGVFVAANFAYGTNPGCTGGILVSGNTTTGAGSVIVVRSAQPNIPAQVKLPDGSYLDPYATTTPITINDATPETVTPTAVSINTDGTVSITANLSHTHGQGAMIASGSIGLQEAINAASAAGGGVVVVDAAWTNFGGTQAILNAATQVAGVSILDNRGTAAQSYSGAAGQTAITFPAAVNIARLTDATAGAYTLATPAAADTGKLLYIESETAQAHTVTTAANKIVDGSGTNGDTLTCGAHIGANCVLMAANLLWTVVTLKNVTLSEV